MDYATLASTIADYLERDDLSSRIGTFVNLAQLKLERATNWSFMLTPYSQAASQSNAFIPLPANFKAVGALFLSGGGYGDSTFIPLENVPFYYGIEKGQGNTDTPRGYVVHQEIGQFRLVPSPNAGYTISGNCYCYLPLLSASVTTNWWSSNAWDCLLYGALLEAAPYLENDAKIATWQSALAGAVSELKTAEAQVKMDERPIRIKASYVV